MTSSKPCPKRLRFLPALLFILVAVPEASALDTDDPLRFKANLDTRDVEALGIVLGEDGIVGDEGDYFAATFTEDSANVCWQFYSSGEKVHVETGDGAVAYVPFVGPGGYQPVELDLPSGLGGYEDWGLGMQEAGTHPSC